VPLLLVVGATTRFFFFSPFQFYFIEYFIDTLSQLASGRVVKNFTWNHNLYLCYAFFSRVLPIIIIYSTLSSSNFSSKSSNLYHKAFSICEKKMSEPEEENNQDYVPRSKPAEEGGGGCTTMDFDLDLETSWPLDHMAFGSNPMSPFLFSTSSDQPYSPLWAFSDGEDPKLPASAFSDCHKIFSCMFSDWFSFA